MEIDLWGKAAGRLDDPVQPRLRHRQKIAGIIHFADHGDVIILARADQQAPRLRVQPDKETERRRLARSGLRGAILRAGGGLFLGLLVGIGASRIRRRQDAGIEPLRLGLGRTRVLRLGIGLSQPGGERGIGGIGEQCRIGRQRLLQISI